MNKQIERLRKIEKRAQMLATLRDINEIKWEKAYQAARNTSEWKAYCESKGSVINYNYGDVIC